jgi:hydrogenase expression/formation protein HypC
MCIGVPMQIVAVEGEHAWCEGMGERKRIDTLLIGQQPVGTCVLVFLDSAREVLEPEDAQHITQAVQAVNLAMQGQVNVEHLFADLIDHEPQLPAFLQTATPSTKKESSTKLESSKNLESSTEIEPSTEEESSSKCVHP